MKTLPREEKELDRLRKDFLRFYSQGVMMAFIEGGLFQDRRRNFTVYESLLVIFIDTEF
jgi:hypothetical protein